jgi:epoxide hydrolase-like predicted phosphatase
MIKAIIFDCFGVLTTDGWIAFKKRHFKDHKLSADKASELNRKTDKGEMDYKHFLTEIGRLAETTAQQVQDEIDNNVTDEELFDYISNLKPKYKVGMLSNAASNYLSDLFQPEQIALFDAVVLSYEAGFIKPEVQAYELIAERLGVEITECIFIDDQEKHVTGARRVGMQAILYRDFPQMKRELEKILSASSNN